MTLSLAARRSALSRFAGGHELDVLVVGGGVVGCGAALDAVTRGLSTGLIEARDYASGTSSRSSKLIHGGLRYLEMLDFGLVHEALQERRLLLTTIAPHLVRPVPFMYPLQKPAWERFYVGSGIALYDGLAFGVKSSGEVPRHKHLSKKAALGLMPSLRPDALTGAIQYHDAQVDDARFTLELARTAAAHGAHVANRVAMTGFLRADASDPQSSVIGVTARDQMTGEEFTIRARRVICATGVWTGEVQSMLGEDIAPLKVRASKGIEKSVLFIIPWDEHWIIGTTDTDWTLDLAHPAATSADIDYLLSTVNRVLVTPLLRDDIDGVYAGLRPLISGDESDATTKLSREHVVAAPVAGVVLVAGGKYTTYRVMAKDAVDLALGISAKKDRKDRDKDRDREVEKAAGPPSSTTDTVPLSGAVGWEWLSERYQMLARASGLPEDAGVRSTSRSRSCMPRPPRVPSSSPTSLLAGPASRSRHAIEVSRPRPTRPRWWRRSWVGMTQRWRVRSTSTTAGWRPRCRARRCPMTPRLNPSGPRRLTLPSEDDAILARRRCRALGQTSSAPPAPEIPPRS